MLVQVKPASPGISDYPLSMFWTKIRNLLQVRFKGYTFYDYVFLVYVFAHYDIIDLVM